MKKRVFLCLLALMLGLSLCACGNDSGSSSSGGSSGGGDNDGGSSQTFVCEGAVTPDASWDLMQYFYGEWKRVDTIPRGDIDSITIRKNGTCLINDVEYPFAFCKNSTKDCIVIHVYKDGRTEYILDIQRYTRDGTELDITLSIGSNSCENILSAINPDTFWNPEQAQEVQLTNDNLWEYFEIKNELNVKKNAFGDITGIEVQQRLVPKEGYRWAYWGHTAAIEFSYVARNVPCEIDLDQSTMSIQDSVDDGKQSSRIVQTGNAWLVVHPLLSQKCRYNATTGTLVGYLTDFEILRSTGNLYLLK